MKSRAARLALLGLFVVALGVSAYLFQKSQSARRTQLSQGQVFDDSARAAMRGVLSLRAAQQAYVATGQDQDLNFWLAQVTSTLATLRQSLTTLRAAAASPDTQAQIDGAVGSLQDFGQMDTRAREYVRAGQKLLASDMIFSNGSEQTDAAVSAIDRAADFDQEARASAVATFERRQTFALVAAAAAAGLVVLLLLPTAEREVPVPAMVERAEAARTTPLAGPTVLAPDLVTSAAEEWGAPRQTELEKGAAVEQRVADTALHADPQSPAALPDVAAAAPASLSAPTFDFTAVAALCTELSRVEDTTALPPLLERAASLLDAAGVILWMADQEGRELTAVLAHGYPQHLISRLGAIPRHAENATAAAFRTGLVQTVDAGDGTNGAIAAPLVTSGGCVGVMAAEVRGRSERQEATLAAATILAAQLASLVGPATARTSEPAVEVANA